MKYVDMKTDKSGLKNKDKNSSRHIFLICACAFLWLMMMGSKNVYTAEIVEIMDVFGRNRRDVSMGMTFYFIVYSVVQIVFCFFMKNVNVKWYILITIGLSGVVTVLIAFMFRLEQLWWLLALNGLLQAMVWGMCMSALKKHLPSRLLPVANTVMNVGTAVAGVISYGTASLFVSFSRWDLPFIVLGILLSLSAVIFFVAVKINEQRINDEEILTATVLQKTLGENLIKLNTKSKIAVFYVVTFILSMLIHCVFYAVMNWMPNLLTDVYGYSNSVGILVSVFAPLATVIGPIIAVYHCEKKENYVGVQCLYLAITAVLGVAIALIYDKNSLLIIVLIIAFLIISQATVTLVFSILPIKVGKFVDTGSHSALMNGAGGIAAGLMPTIIGSVIDTSGWAFSYIVIAIVCVVNFLSILLIFLLMNNKRKKMRIN